MAFAKKVSHLGAETASQYQTSLQASKELLFGLMLGSQAPTHRDSDPAVLMIFGDLPPELIEQILCHVPWLDIVQCRKENTSVALQLRIELALDGMMLNPDAMQSTQNGALTARTMIERVKERRNALRYPEPQLQRVLHCPHTGRYPFEVCDGVWGRADSQIGSYFHEIKYDFLRPTITRDHSRTHVHKLDMPIDDFIFWVAGDLQILLEERDHGTKRRLHFRTFSKNLPHPRAKFPFLDIHREQCNAWNHCVLHLYADRVGIVFTQSVWQGIDNIGSVMVWDWVNGKMILPYMHALDAAFISRDYILRLVNADKCLALAVTPLDREETIHLLELPITDNFFGAHFVPHPFYNTRSDLVGVPPSEFSNHLPIFTPDISMDILVLEHQYKGAEDERNGHLMVISIRHLLERCQMQHSGAYGGATIIWKWDEWGPHIARWLPYGMGKASRRAVFGSRLLVAAPLDLGVLQNRSNTTAETVWQGARLRLILLDFNSRSISRSLDGENQDGDSSEDHIDSLVKEISRWSIDHHLPYSTTSRLKFRATLLESAVEYLNVYLDGDGFVGRKEDCYDVFSFMPPIVD